MFSLPDLRQKSPRRTLRPISILLTFILAVGSLAFPLVSVAATTPSILSYQGRLADSGGNLLGGSGTTYYFRFSIWDNSNVGSGTRLWPTSSPSSVPLTVRQGVFTANIGDTAAGYPDVLNYDFTSASDIYLQVEVSSDNSTFQTLSPRQRISASAFAQLSRAVSGTGSSSFGTTTPIQNSVVSVQSTSTNAIGVTIRAIASQVANLFQIQDSTGTNLFTVDGNGGITGTAATTTSLYATTASSTNLSTSNLSIGSLTGILRATAGVVTSALVNLASDVTGVLGIAHGGTGTSTVPTYGKLLIGNAGGTYDLIATSSLGLIGNGAVSSVDISGGSTGLTAAGGPITTSGVLTLGGILNAASGGTGINSYTNGDILYASGGALTKLPIGFPGQVLKITATSYPAWGPDLTGGGFFLASSSNLSIVEQDPTQVLILGALATTSTGTIFEVAGNSLFRNNITAYGAITAPYFSATSTTATSTFSGSLSVLGTASSSNSVVSNTLTLSSLSGFLKATAGVVGTSLINLGSDVTGIVAIANGGTGLSSVSGNSLIYTNSAGTAFAQVATSSLS
ncbi:MAG: hypothetical protein RLZZ26_490, partial [Candidatus Parcubacteria bacterium]